MSPPVHAQPLDPEQIVTHDPFVRGLARRLLRDAHAADDVAQLTWIAACTRPVAAVSLRDWLLAVARRFAGKRARADRRELLRQQAVARPEQLPSTAAIVEREALRAEVVRAVLELAEPYRTVVLLRWFEDLPPREIARRLAVPVETVRTRLKRALAELRARLDRHAGGDRAAWCALLVPIAFRKGHAAASGGLFSFVAGVTLMSLPLRFALAGLLLAGVLASTLWLSSGAPEEPPQQALVTATLPALAVAPSDAPPAPAEMPGAAATDGGRTRVEGAVASTGSLHVRAVFHDKTPAAGIEIELHRSGTTDVLARRRDYTDAGGELRLGDEAPGGVYVAVTRPDGRYGVRCEVIAGREILVELELPRGIDARGIVVDKDGAPVAGAEIVAADWSGQAAHALGHSAADGTFTVRSLTTHCHIGARAQAYCASSMHTITTGEGAIVDLRLLLLQPAAVVTGLVLGPDEQPVSEALVRVGSDKQDNHRLPDGAQAMAPRPMVVRTGADGRFVAASLPAGKLPLAVRVRDLAPWQDTIEVAVGERREVTVRLQQGVTLAGVVRDARGAPVAKAEVRVGEWRSLGHQRRVTDASGAFAFVGLPVGEVQAFAEHDELGKADTTLRGLPGERLRWEPVLSVGIVLSGRVVDDADQPVAGVILEAHSDRWSDGGQWFGHASSGDDGRFQLQNCKPGMPICINVRRGALRELRLRGVVPGNDEFVVRLPKIGWVRVKGRAVGPDDKPLPNVSIQVSKRDAGGDLEKLDPASGAFDVGPYPPGELMLRLETPGYAPLRVRRTLQPDEVCDLGTLTFARGGTLELNVVADSTLPATKSFVSVFDAGGDWVDKIEITAGRGRGGPWAEGDYVLQLSGGDGLAAVRQPFSIRVDVATKVDMHVQGGVEVAIVFALPDGAVADSVPVEVLGARDALVLGTSASWRSGAVELRTVLRPGSYRVRVPDGEFTGESALEVAAPGPVEAKVALRLR